MEIHDNAVPIKNTINSVSPKPFVKWAGGKTQLLPELTSRVPRTFQRYYEPFLGGGALFFSLQPENAFLSDINAELINVYRVVKNNVEKLIASLRQHVYEESYFYAIREVDRSLEYVTWSNVEKASRLIYLNKTCFNGLYRVNSKGHFNAPFGDYHNPKICDPENLRACSQVLQNATIRTRSYLCIERHLQKGDFVYFDPPYAPLNPTSNFTNYSKDGFRRENQEALRDLCVRLDKKGVLWMLSNSAAPLILELYSEYNIELVEALRAINSKAGKRGKIKEVIVRNYD
ncbi:MAG: DNA adenine methylase [Stigonema ocellatum SAG 48.90 = DSM 106950]|nr:DNA adenine methylase [Stigonema ocellatum SAG 48.90 = DSM 106950]